MLEADEPEAVPDCVIDDSDADEDEPAYATETVAAEGDEDD